MKKTNIVLVVLTVAVVALGIALLRVTAFKGETVKTETPAFQGEDMGNFRAISFAEGTQMDPFRFFAGDGLLLAAGDIKTSNAMTIGWGTFGLLWGEPVATVYVREDRFTHKFTEESDYFTIMSFQDKKVLAYMGSHSGRDADKAKELGLHTYYTKHGAPYYAEADTVIECRKLAATTFADENFCDSVPRRMYANTNGAYHTQYIGKVVGAWAKKQ